MTTETGVVHYPAEIAKAIVGVMKEVNYVEKKGKNNFHNYKFAAVGDLLAKLQPAMAEQGLVVIQSEVDREFLANNSVLAIRYAFTLAHQGGHVWPANPIHTGMTACLNSKGGFDDKTANKCQTAARKYFLLSLFQIPTGDHADPDEDEDRGPQAKQNSKDPEPEQITDPEVEAEKKRIMDLVMPISKAVKKAPDTKTIDDIVKVQAKTLAEVAGSNKVTYDWLMKQIEDRRAQLTTNQEAA